MKATDTVPTLWIVESASDLDELYSDLRYMPSCVAITADGKLWEVWADPESGGLILRHLDRCSAEIETRSFAQAFGAPLRVPTC